MATINSVGDRRAVDLVLGVAGRNGPRAEVVIGRVREVWWSSHGTGSGGRHGGCGLRSGIAGDAGDVRVRELMTNL